MQARIEGAEPCRGRFEKPLKRALKPCTEIGEVLARVGQVRARIVMQNHCRQLGNAILPQPKSRSHCGVQAENCIVQPLGKPMQEGGEPGLGAGNFNAGKALAGLQKLITGGALEPMRLRSQVARRF